jgi:hypothetical protein
MSDSAERNRVSRYRRLHLSVWGDEKFRHLSPQKASGQALWLYLLQGPHTRSVPGLSHAGEAGLAERLGWPLAAFRRCWEEIETGKMARADWANQVVWVPNAIYYNAPANPNVVRGWRPYLVEIPDCRLKDEAIKVLGTVTADLGEPFAKAFNELFDKPTPERLRERLA